ncbi:hypothetical protein L596_029933 [Steinernema carpocapsae]|uniref:Uncharacterized protein n=1 Tax=Steinernema carpocapsae TaxID=34508 RepID=A0A4V5ZX56_STECR|nr:hypothetical protein L596_029933 [Steinernema carpocapsae]
MVLRPNELDVPKHFSIWSHISSPLYTANSFQQLFVSIFPPSTVNNFFESCSSFSGHRKTSTALSIYSNLLINYLVNWISGKWKIFFVRRVRVVSSKMSVFKSSSSLLRSHSTLSLSSMAGAVKWLWRWLLSISRVVAAALVAPWIGSSSESPKTFCP